MTAEEWLLSACTVIGIALSVILSIIVGQQDAHITELEAKVNTPMECRAIVEMRNDVIIGELVVCGRDLDWAAELPEGYEQAPEHPRENGVWR